MDTATHHTHSTLRERIVEHVFVGEALRTLWRLGITDVEVLRSEFDAHGHDLMMARSKIVRHIQFKSGADKRPSWVSVATALAERPSGCVIFIRVDRGLSMGPYYWFGAAPGSPLPRSRRSHTPAGPPPAARGESRRARTTMVCRGGCLPSMRPWRTC